MATLHSYDLNGKKLSFANWISNISPTDTPFLSMTKKDSVDQTIFQWQTDSLRKIENNAQIEGWESGTAPSSFLPTKVMSNYTQIFRKVISVSDTTNSIALYGREKELSYQMEKAGKELKRDIEYAFLNNLVNDPGSSTSPRRTAGFAGLCSNIGIGDYDTNAVLNFDRPELKEEYILEMCENLYKNGSNANVIMFHPKNARFFSKLQESATRSRFFDNIGDYSILVNIFVDQFGNKYKLVPNRYMNSTRIFFFNPDNWVQKILRPLKKVKLAKLGSYEQWMIETEIGLLHVNPEASGILNIRSNRTSRLEIKTVGGKNFSGDDITKIFGTDFSAEFKQGESVTFSFKTINAGSYVVDLYKDYEIIQTITAVGNNDTTVYQIIGGSVNSEASGVYKFILKDSTGKVLDESAGMNIVIK